MEMKALGSCLSYPLLRVSDAFYSGVESSSRRTDMVWGFVVAMQSCLMLCFPCISLLSVLVSCCICIYQRLNWNLHLLATRNKTAMAVPSI